MGTFANRRGQNIKTFQKEDGEWVACEPSQHFTLEVEFFEGRTEIWVAVFDNVGRELQRWNVSFVRSIIWEK